MRVHFLAGAAVGALARPLVLPVFVGLEAGKFAGVGPAATDDPPNLWDTVLSGFEYAIGYYIGNWAMTSVFGASQ